MNVHSFILFSTTVTALRLDQTDLGHVIADTFVETMKKNRYIKPERDGFRDIFSERSYRDYFENGFVDSQVTLPSHLQDQIRRHFYAMDPSSASDNALKTIDTHNHAQAPDWYGKAWSGSSKIGSYYDRAMYSDETKLAPVFKYLFNQNLSNMFQTRYMMITHDIFLQQSHNQTGFPFHWDAHTWEQPIEGPFDLSIWIPLTDVNSTVGGRLGVMPRSFHPTDEFSGACLRGLRETARVLKPHLHEAKGVLETEKFIDFLDKHQDHPAFEVANQKCYSPAAEAALAHEHIRFIPHAKAGQVLIFSNKQWHHHEPWQAATHTRDVYIVRMAPVYDLNVKWKPRWGQKTANNVLLDFEKNKVIWHDYPHSTNGFQPQDRHAF